MTNRQENNGAGQGQSHPEQGQPLGMVIEGSVANGVDVRLDPGVGGNAANHPVDVRGIGAHQPAQSRSSLQLVALGHKGS